MAARRSKARMIFRTAPGVAQPPLRSLQCAQRNRPASRELRGGLACEEPLSRRQRPVSTTRSRAGCAISQAGSPMSSGAGVPPSTRGPWRLQMRRDLPEVVLRCQSFANWRHGYASRCGVVMGLRPASLCPSSGGERDREDPMPVPLSVAASCHSPWRRCDGCRDLKPSKCSARAILPRRDQSPERPTQPDRNLATSPWGALHSPIPLRIVSKKSAQSKELLGRC